MLELAIHYAMLSDAGTERQNNEDACGAHVESASHVVVAVADGVSGEEGGEIASQTAIEVTLRRYRENAASWGPAKRLFRAAQEANITIHDKALVVTELRRMATTLTAVVVDGNVAHAVHVGDCRLYLVRRGEIVQKTMDHTLAARRRRLTLGGTSYHKNHPARSTLTRSLGRELIAAIDRIEFPVADGDTLVVCSDGLYNVLDDDEIRVEVERGDVTDCCQRLVGAANDRGAPDNLTVAVMRVSGGPQTISARGWRAVLDRWLGRKG
jgi:protein phosphatase